jgi:hypothetical protein
LPTGISFTERASIGANGGFIAKTISRKDGSDGFLVLFDARTGGLLEKHALNDETDPGRRNLHLIYFGTFAASTGRL